MGHCAVFSCPPETPGTPAHPAAQRPPLLKWILSLLVCCWGSRHSQSSGDTESDGDGDGVELGPMTLREYINSLEPYNPELHGWRGDEPRRRPGPTSAPSQANGTPPQYAYASVAYHPRKRNSARSRSSRII